MGLLFSVILAFASFQTVVAESSPLTVSNGSLNTSQNTPNTVFEHLQTPPSQALLMHVGVEKAFCRSLKGCKNAGVYATIHLPQQDVLQRVDVSPEIADRAELHTHKYCEGIMRMMPVPEIEAPEGQLVLKPGSLHIMLMDLKRDLDAGEKIKLVLHFKEAGCVTINVPVITKTWKATSPFPSRTDSKTGPKTAAPKTCPHCPQE